MTIYDINSYVYAKPFMGVSDHIPVSFNIRKINQSKKRSYNIPRWVLNNEQGFLEKFEELWIRTDTPEDPFQKLNCLKKCLIKTSKNIARTVRTAPQNSLQKLTILIAAFRKLSAKNVNIVSLLRMEHLNSEIAEAIRDNDITSAKILTHDAIEEILEREAQPREEVQKKQGLNFIQQAKIFLPSSRTSLKGLRESTDVDPTTDPKDMARIAKRFWEKIWAKPKTNKHLRERFLKGYQKKIEDIPMFTQYDIYQSISKSNNSAAGPDGIPFKAYRVIIDYATPILFEVALDMALTETTPPRGFNFSRLNLLPKKSTFLPEDTRPISIPNSDNRVISTIIKNTIHDPVAAFLHKAQKAFIRGLHIQDHVYDVNKVFYQNFSKQQQHFLLLLDFKKAYDLVDHEFLLAVLEHIGMPR